MKKALINIYRNFLQIKNSFTGIKARYDLINNIIVKNGFKSYLEIGVQDGICLRNIKCENKVGVDPFPMVKNVAGAAINLCTSDEFFEKSDEKFDLIFIDGLHTHEQSYKDFLNATEHLNKGGRIVLHDCNPRTETHARSFADGGKWNGDVYKTILKINSSGNFTVKTVDIDHGCGIIELVPSGKKYEYEDTYEWFNKNRKTALNLISWDEFLRSDK